MFGDGLTFYLLVVLAVFIVGEFFAWFTGRQTMSMRVIYWVFRSRKAAWFWFCFAVGVALVGIWLVFHWELPCALWGAYCWVKV